MIHVNLKKQYTWFINRDTFTRIEETSRENGEAKTKKLRQKLFHSIVQAELQNDPLYFTDQIEIVIIEDSFVWIGR